jgi:hypothetical protein
MQGRLHGGVLRGAVYCIKASVLPGRAGKENISIAVCNFARGCVKVADVVPIVIDGEYGD